MSMGNDLSALWGSIKVSHEPACAHRAARVLWKICMAGFVLSVAGGMALGVYLWVVPAAVVSTEVQPATQILKRQDLTRVLEVYERRIQAEDRELRVADPSLSR